MSYLWGSFPVLRIWSSLESRKLRPKSGHDSHCSELFLSGCRVGGGNSDLISLPYISCFKPFTSFSWLKYVRSFTVNLQWLPLKFDSFQGVFFFLYLDVVMVALSALISSVIQPAPDWVRRYLLCCQCWLHNEVDGWEMGCVVSLGI